MVGVDGIYALRELEAFLGLDVSNRMNVIPAIESVLWIVDCSRRRISFNKGSQQYAEHRLQL